MEDLELRPRHALPGVAEPAVTDRSPQLLCSILRRALPPGLETAGNIHVVWPFRPGNETAEHHQHRHAIRPVVIGVSVQICPPRNYCCASLAHLDRPTSTSHQELIWVVILKVSFAGISVGEQLVVKLNVVRSEEHTSELQS